MPFLLLIIFVVNQL